MADYKVYRSSRFDENDSTLYDWTLDVHLCDGNVTRAKFEATSADLIVEVCKTSLLVKDDIEIIFLWCNDSWWGSVSRA